VRAPHVARGIPSAWQGEIAYYAQYECNTSGISFRKIKSNNYTRGARRGRGRKQGGGERGNFKKEENDVNC
jgi:hypothetical protein